MRRNRTLTENLPSSRSKRKINNRGRKSAPCRPPVNDEWNSIADLVANRCRVRTLGRTLQIRGSRRDGQSEALYDRTWNGRIRDAQGNVSCVCSRPQGQPCASPNNDRKRSRPEAIREPVKHRIAIARQRIRLGQRRNQKRKRLVLLPGLDLVDTLDCAKVHGIDRKAIKGVRGKGYNVTFSQAGDDIVDPVWLGFIGMDAQDFRGQESLPRFPNCRSHKDGSYHSTTPGAS
jgi:hypothetical protein